MLGMASKVLGFIQGNSLVARAIGTAKAGETTMVPVDPAAPWLKPVFPVLDY